MSVSTEKNKESLTSNISESAKEAAELPAELLRTEIEQVSRVYQIMVDFFANYSFQLIGALLIFILGYSVAGKIAKAVLRLCEKHKLDITLSRFLASTTKMVVLVLVSIIALNKLGISVTPFVAAIGAISLGAGLALQGLLANHSALCRWRYH